MRTLPIPSAGVSEAFAAATAVELVAVDGAISRYRSAIHEGWDIGGNANGGYILAVVGRAMAMATDRPPLTLTGHYLAPAPPGACEILVTMVRPGGRLATCTAALVQDGRELLRALGTFGTPADPGHRYVDGGPPAVPPYAECPARAAAPPESGVPRPGLVDRLDVRVHPDSMGFASGAPRGRAEMTGWFALAAEEPIDEIGLLLAADAMAPAIFNSGLPIGWVPTVELTVHVRARPAPGPLRCRFVTRFIAGGTLEEDGELWDSSDTLVAQSRQLALTPRGR